MKNFRLRRPSAAMLVAMLALFVALAGGAYAATSINGRNIMNRSIAGSKLKNNTLTGTQINESRLGQVPKAKHADSATKAATAANATNADAVGGATLASLALGRSTVSGCDPNTTAFADCGTVSLTLPRAARLLVLASLGYDGSNSNNYSGNCRLAVDGSTIGATIDYGQATYVPTTVVGGPGYNANGQEGGTLNAVSDVLPAGAHTASLQCNQAGGSIEFEETEVSALMISAG